MRETLSPADWQTLRLIPLWIFSAVTGRQSRFKPGEVESFWQSIEDSAAGSVGLARQVLGSLSSDRVGVLAEFELENRAIVSGLCEAASILARESGGTAAEFTAVMMRVGENIGRARGPYGRSVNPEDEQTLLLLAELLDARIELADH